MVKHIKKMLLKKPERFQSILAKYVCVAMLVFPDGKIYKVREECKGSIEFMPKGEHGFGYDPIFLVPEYDKTFAELEGKIKNQISHRGKAMKRIINIINE